MSSKAKSSSRDSPFKCNLFPLFFLFVLILAENVWLFARIFLTESMNKEFVVESIARYFLHEYIFQCAASQVPKYQLSEVAVFVMSEIYIWTFNMLGRILIRGKSLVVMQETNEPAILKSGKLLAKIRESVAVQSALKPA
jgi:hypothetical protein